MISEISFIGAENLPEEMAGAFDVPWKFLGELAPKYGRNGIYTSCRCEFDGGLPNGRLVSVCLPAFTFITDDMLYVDVYFGRCPSCRRVYWARSGPPFERVRGLVMAE